uniref:Membrane protein n=1 Tax=Dikerogammarus haemobaphes virus 1 TaxID=2704946 RepID=A0A6G9HDG9_9VIRU|nr:membrane protein [Dikerogammarus haemobaphes virus 1]
MPTFQAVQTDVVRLILYIFKNLQNIKCKLLLILIFYDIFSLLVIYKLFMKNGYQCIRFFDAKYAPIDIVEICMIISKLGYLKYINLLNSLYQMVQCGLNIVFVLVFNFYKNILCVILLLKIVFFVRYGSVVYNLYLCSISSKEIGKIMVWDTEACLWKYPLNFNCTIEANTYMVARREQYFCSSSAYDINYLIVLNAMIVHAISIGLYIIYITLSIKKIKIYMAKLSKRKLKVLVV